MSIAYAYPVDTHYQDTAKCAGGFRSITNKENVPGSSGREDIPWREWMQ
jgi:hypothetical protein